MIVRLIVYQSLIHDGSSDGSTNIVMETVMCNLLISLRYDGSDGNGHCSGDSEIAIARASDGFYTTGPDLFLRGATHVRTG